MLNATELIGFGVGGNEAHRYWRILDTSGFVPFILVEMEMRGSVGGSDLATNTAKAISGSLDNGEFNAALRTTYTISGTASQYMDEVVGAGGLTWVGYDFDVPTAIAEIYTVWVDDYTHYPVLQVQWSDDRINWFNIGTAHDLTSELVSKTGCYYDEDLMRRVCPANSFGWTLDGLPYPWLSIVVGT